MNLESVTAELRPRGPWEAVDFGARMVRRDAGVIYKVWFATTLPALFLATLGLIYLDSPFLVWATYWWFEPVFGAPVLYIISRRLFGERTNVGTALRAVPGLAIRNWIFLVTPLRLHFARSVAMPLVQLEQLSGARRRARAKVMNQVTMNHGIGVTAAYQNLGLAIVFGIVLLGFAFVPEVYQESIGLSWFDNMVDDQSVAASLLNLYCFYIAQTILHPWFVGAGFGLYINCRTMLEAWDIEVAFRRMLQRRANRTGAAAAALLLAFVLLPMTLQADEQQIEPYYEEDFVERAVESVYDEDAMQTKETETYWRRIDDEDDDEEEDASASDRELSGFGEFLRDVGKVISVLFELGLWIVVALALVAIFMTRKYWLPYLNIEPRVRQKKERVILSTGEITAETIPDDLPGSVMALWRQGNAREALSLLYRGSVFGAVHRHGVRLPKSATEGDCISAVDQQTAESHASFFSRVAYAWVWCAYGATAPPESAMQAMCSEWPAHYEATE